MRLKGCGFKKEPEGYICGLRGKNWKSYYLCSKCCNENFIDESDVCSKCKEHSE